MAFRIVVGTGTRELSAQDLEAVLGGHPPEVIAGMIERLGALDQVEPVKTAAAAIAAHLHEVCATVWTRQIEPGAPGGEGLAFVAPPPAAVAKQPRRIDRGWSTYLAVANLDGVIAQGSKALAYFVPALELPPVGSPERAMAIRRATRELGAIVRAARSAAIVRRGAEPRVLALAPGELPEEIEAHLARFLGAVRRDELIAPAVLASWTLRPDDTLIGLGEIYDGIDTLLREAGAALDETGAAFAAGGHAPWTLEGTRLRTGQPLAPLLDGSQVREHVVIPGLSAPPPTIYGEEIEDAVDQPLVFVLSDLHLGQGPLDGAEEIEAGLDAAFVQALDGWSARLALHRTTHAGSPAYLVLNGDILDFWSADVIPGAAPTSDLTGRRIGGVARAQLLPDAAGARMERILAAHPAFFQRVAAWVQEAPINFLVYVCGNHDDHLVRYNLGGALVQRLAGPRGVFAAKSAYFPQLCLLIEHGHRSDDHNRTDPAFDHGFGCLGELIVAMLINPVERGGLAPFLDVRDEHGATADVLGAHGLPGELDAVRRELTKLRDARAATKLYSRIFREIDNLENSGAEDVLVDYAARLARRAGGAHAGDAVERVMSAIDELQSIWTGDAYQSLKVKLGGLASPIFPPYARAWAIDGQFARNHPSDLGFVPGAGLHGKRSMRVHVVGHTHRPRLTTPPLAGAPVTAQHVNTGTGQNMWRLSDTTKGIDLASSLGITESQDRIDPVHADQYCLVYLAHADNKVQIHVEGGSYRMLQAGSPLNSGQPVSGGLVPGGTNTLER